MLLLSFGGCSAASTLLLLNCCIPRTLISLPLICSRHVTPRILHTNRGLRPFLMHLVLHKNCLCLNS